MAVEASAGLLLLPFLVRYLSLSQQEKWRETSLALRFPERMSQVASTGLFVDTKHSSNRSTTPSLRRQLLYASKSRQTSLLCGLSELLSLRTGRDVCESFL